MINTLNYYSQGKLLLTGEYLILDGAIGLALPSKYGQRMTVEPYSKPEIIWKSYDNNEKLWFEAVIKLMDINSAFKNFDNSVLSRLLSLLSFIKRFRSDLFNQGYKITLKTDFPRQWGLGTSSTMINNLALFSKLNPYELLWSTFTGSGYDIACARSFSPILYKLNNDKTPEVRDTFFKPSFYKHIYFIYLNHKQNTHESLKRYLKIKKDKKKIITQVTEISLAISRCHSLSDFENLIDTHENLLSQWLGLPKVKDIYFKDYARSIKSLGAWGGDFILVTTSNPEDLNYFRKKGYDTILKYSQMVL